MFIVNAAGNPNPEYSVTITHKTHKSRLYRRLGTFTTLRRAVSAYNKEAKKHGAPLNVYRRGMQRAAVASAPAAPRCCSATHG